MEKKQMHISFGGGARSEVFVKFQKKKNLWGGGGAG